MVRVIVKRLFLYSREENLSKTRRAAVGDNDEYCTDGDLCWWSHQSEANPGRCGTRWNNSSFYDDCDAYDDDNNNKVG